MTGYTQDELLEDVDGIVQHIAGIKKRRRGGIQRQKEGLGRVSINAKVWLGVMRQRARRIAKQRGSVTCDDLRECADRHNHQPHHPNAWGAIFKTKEWRICWWRQSKYPSNHGRRIAVWGLTNKETNHERITSRQ